MVESCGRSGVYIAALSPWMDPANPNSVHVMSPVYKKQSYFVTPVYHSFSLSEALRYTDGT
jgi:hypothetical protein